VLGGLLGIAVVGGTIFMLVMAPSLGLATNSAAPGGNPPEIHSDSFSLPVADATSADISIGISHWATRIAAQPGEDLFTADVDYTGQMQFETSGGAERSVHLEEDLEGLDFLNLFGNLEGRWDIGLNPDVPIALTVDGATAYVDMDLRDLTLTEFSYDAGPGATTLTLPTSPDRYPVEIDQGPGSMELTIEPGADIELNYEGETGSTSITIGEGAAVTAVLELGAGSTSIDVPDGAAVRVEVDDDGAGSLSVGGGMARVSSDGDTGVWETPNFEDADVQITIRIEDAGPGSISID
jgi:hypothetical protein